MSPDGMARHYTDPEIVRSEMERVVFYMCVCNFTPDDDKPCYGCRLNAMRRELQVLHSILKAHGLRGSE